MYSFYLFGVTFESNSWTLIGYANSPSILLQLYSNDYLRGCSVVAAVAAIMPKKIESNQPDSFSISFTANRIHPHIISERKNVNRFDCWFLELWFVLCGIMFFVRRNSESNEKETEIPWQQTTAHVCIIILWRERKAHFTHILHTHVPVEFMSEECARVRIWFI